MPSWLADKNGKRHSQGTRLSWGMLGNRARDDATNSAHRFHYVQTCVVPEPLTHTGVVPPLTPLLEYHSTPQLPSSIRLAHTTDHTADQPPDLVNTPTLTSETTAWGIETPTSQRHNEADLAAAQQPSFSVHDVPGFYPSDVTGMGMEDTVGESNYGSASYHLTLPANVRKVAKAAVIEAATRRRRCKAEFQCKLGCGQTFTTRHNLNYHHKAHQGIKEHECRHSVCNAQFVTPSDRRRHEAKCPLKIIIPSAALNPAPDA
ncbi:hypothetical protein VNI00_006020 [Paramarasmius palmivorus]|uniref:C2H2-type domain-containing protein n=1 Tax=Paramarasmius palmivorus TaxID=297713 RepID=A0AAW0DF62_9AGAR